MFDVPFQRDDVSKSDDEILYLQRAKFLWRLKTPPAVLPLSYHQLYVTGEHYIFGDIPIEMSHGFISGDRWPLNTSIMNMRKSV
jgi:hypothetical protein